MGGHRVGVVPSTNRAIFGHHLGVRDFYVKHWISGEQIIESVSIREGVVVPGHDEEIRRNSSAYYEAFHKLKTAY